MFLSYFCFFYTSLYYLASYLTPYNLQLYFFFVRASLYIPCILSKLSRAINRSLPILNSPYRRPWRVCCPSCQNPSAPISTHGKTACHQSRSDKRLSRCTLVGETDVGGNRCRQSLRERRRVLSSRRSHDADVVTNEQRTTVSRAVHHNCARRIAIRSIQWIHW